MTPFRGWVSRRRAAYASLQSWSGRRFYSLRRKNSLLARKSERGKGENALFYRFLALGNTLLAGVGEGSLGLFIPSLEKGVLALGARWPGAQAPAGASLPDWSGPSPRWAPGWRPF